jgi:membrane-bound ClpP family serine protease
LADLRYKHEFDEKLKCVLCAASGFLIVPRSKEKGVKMLGAIAAVLIVLWLLGFLAFHVSSGLIHILLVIGVVMLLLHFFSGRSATA